MNMMIIYKEQNSDLNLITKDNKEKCEYKHKLVIFDLDDTLITTREATLLGRDAAIGALFGENPSVQDRFVLLGKWQRLSWFFGSDEWRVALTVLAIEGGISDSVQIRVKKAEDILHTVFFLNIQLVIGVEEILMKLIEMGIKIGLVSNGPKSRQQKKLEETKLNRYFNQGNVIIEPDESKISKPHADQILKMCHQMNIQPKDTLVVGDRVSDIVAANLAGCWSVLFYRRNLEIKHHHNQVICLILKYRITQYQI